MHALHVCKAMSIFFQTKRFYGTFFVITFSLSNFISHPSSFCWKQEVQCIIFVKMDCTTFAKVDPTTEIIVLNLEATKLILVCSFYLVHHFSISNFFVLSVLHLSFWLCTQYWCYFVVLQRFLLLLFLCEFLWFRAHLSFSIFVWLFTFSSSFAIVGSLHIKVLLVVVFGHVMLLLV